MRNCLTLTFCLLCLICHTAGIQAQEQWPQFRGPNGDGHAETGSQIATEWSEQKNVTWKMAIEGEGFSSPVISGDQIWLTTAIVEPADQATIDKKLAEVPNPRGIEIVGKLHLKAQCFSLKSGKLLHNVTVFEIDDPKPKHAQNSFASPTPSLNGHQLFVHFGSYGTAAIDTQTAEIIWSNQSQSVAHQNGPGSSPVLWKDFLVAHYDGMDQQYIAAFDTRNGQLAWKTMRTGSMDPKEEFKKAYCSPQIVEVQGKGVVISPAANWVYGYDAETGTELWKAEYGQLGFSTVPKPIVGHGMAYICTSFMKSKLLAVKYAGSGNVTQSNIVWTSERQVPKKTSLLLVGKELYFVSDNGIATCVDALNGEEIWRARLTGNYAASPLYANGMIYFFNQKGLCTVVEAGREYKEVQKNQLDEGFMASAAVSGDHLILRTEGSLYRIDP